MLWLEVSANVALFHIFRKKKVKFAEVVRNKLILSCSTGTQTPFNKQGMNM